MVTVFLAVLLLGADLRHPDDACLRAIAVAGSSVWAAGDEGTLLVSRDGGKGWERLPLGVAGSFLGLHFQDERRGWLVGREEAPAGPTGLLFFTRDGGKTWNRALPGVLPPLHGIVFDKEKNPDNGFMWGEASPLQPGGLFQTTDGGKSWQAVNSAKGLAGGWRAGLWNAKGVLSLAGLDGSLGEWRDGSLRQVDLDLRPGTAGVNALAGTMAAGGNGLLIERGANGWQASTPPLSREAGRQCEWLAASETGGRHLVVGNPGSLLLTCEKGQVQVVRTGQQAPLHAVCQGADGVAYCAGELGRVLRSADHGATWVISRGADQQLAVTGFVGGEQAHAWCSTGRLGAVDGWRVAVIRALAPEMNLAGAHGRFLQAARHGGAAWVESWRESPPAAFDRLGDVAAAHGMLTAGMPGLVGKLVLALRVQRPRLVLVVGNHGGPQAGMEQALSRLVLDAVRQASDPAYHPEHLSELGLECWSVARVLARAAPRAETSGRVDTQEVQDCLGDSLEDWCSQARALVLPGQEWESGEPLECWNQVLPAGQQTKRLAGLMDGMEADAVGMRRPQNLAESPDDETRKALRLRNQIRAMALAPPGGLNNPQNLEAALLPALEKLPDNQAAALLSRLATNQARQGGWMEAREMHRLLVSKYPTSPLSPASCRWLLAHGASGEVRRRYELTQRVERGLHQVGMPDLSAPSLVRQANLATNQPRPPVELSVQSHHETSWLNHREQSRRWLEECLAQGAVLEAHGAQLANDPLVQFSLQSARRQLGQVEEARAYHRRLANGLPPDSPWRSAAGLEIWLTDHQGECPRPLLACRKATVRPHLDGKLDDPCWQGTFRTLRGGAREELAQFAMGYDSDFLYLAAICPSPGGPAVEGLASRGRDSASPHRDRVGWHLDIDRDYSTGYRLVVDQTGGVSDACWLDQSWDPRWFVKVRQGEGTWTVEAAIPLAMLCPSTPTPNQAWLLQCTRARPGHPPQGWVGTPDAPERHPRPESQGILLFLGEPVTRAAP